MGMDNAIRLMLVDRDDRCRTRFAAAIAAHPRLLLADCHATWTRALERLPLIRPDVLLAGVSLAEREVFDLVRCVKSMVPSSEILVTVDTGDEHAALAWLAAGAAGCVSKSCGSSELAAHLLQLRNGGCPILPAVVRLLLEQVRVPDRPEFLSAPGTSRITRREADVLRMLACGCTYLVASERLGVSLHTVTTHIKSAYRKLEVHSAGAAVMRAVELRIIGEG
jgi:DNA-binding NarL/FixJ family response regulator